MTTPPSADRARERGKERERPGMANGRTDGLRVFEAAPRRRREMSRQTVVGCNAGKERERERERERKRLFAAGWKEEK